VNSFSVLIVDDEKEFLETLVKRLKKRKLDAKGAGNGENALKMLKHNAVDVVVLDVRMPGMDGIETLREIKNDFPLTEVVMLTGHACMEVAVEGMEIGAFDYLMKPVDIDELVYKLQDAYKKKLIHEEKIKNLERLKGN